MCALHARPQEVFMRTTAMSYAWAVNPKSEVHIEAGINDVQLDRMKTEYPCQTSSGCYDPGHATHDQCPVVVQLTAEQVRKQIVLLQDGLLGRGEHMCCVCWKHKYVTVLQLGLQGLSSLGSGT